MTKETLVELYSKKMNTTKVNAKESLEGLIETIKEAVKGGEEVNLTGFISIKPVKKEARVGRNPRTGDSIKIPAKTLYKSKVSKQF